MTHGATNTQCHQYGTGGARFIWGAASSRKYLEVVLASVEDVAASTVVEAEAATGRVRVYAYHVVGAIAMGRSD